MIDVPESRFFAHPEEAAVLEPHRIVAALDPSLARLAKQSLRCAAFEIGRIEIEPCLLAILNLIDDAAAVRRPIDVDDQEVASGVAFRVDLARCGAVRRDSE